ncbi:hypothetical protein ACPPVO_53900 [Dactylosporangium sp. McL0621]|uniref:hypothetical protein n=1 Tax=Dactylosporangium sp. McL0621 TaxID=3415678 RepID=UPI003CEA3CB0
MIIARRLLVVVAAAALSGCGSSSTPTSAPAAAPSVPATTASSPSPSPTVAKMDAKAAADALAAAGLPVTNVAAQDENTDPNNLLGRPGGYLSRASFDVPGGDKDAEPYDIDHGGVVEVFADASAAQARSKYIQDAQKSMQILGTEYHYLNGSVLVRITGKVKPSVAKPFEAAVAGLKVV